MPRFYFHLRDDVNVDDEEGQELPDLATAREVAITTARQLAAESVGQGNLHLDHYIEIANESAAIVARVIFRDAIAVDG